MVCLHALLVAAAASGNAAETTTCAANEQPPLQSVRRFPATTDPAVLINTILEDGAVIVEGMFDEETIAEVRAVADAHAFTLSPGASTQGLGADGKEFVGANTIRFSSLAARTPAFFKMLDNDLYHSIVEPILKCRTRH